MLRKNMTLAEKRMWYEVLRNKQVNGFRFLKQRPIDNYIVDFFCSELQLVIEIDGSSYVDREEYDIKRTEVLESYGLRIFRYSNEDVLTKIEIVKDHLFQNIYFPLVEGD
jgi:very-short-patch-repair endonuclease